MRSFRVEFKEDASGKARTIEFEGISPSAVFTIMESEEPNQRVSLWEGDIHLGYVERNQSGVWDLG